MLTQHQQGVERYREEIERAASCQTAGAKFVDWQNPEWDVLESQAKSSDEGGGGFPAGELPQGLSIEPIGATVKIIVPASAADGDFELTDSEALSAGVRLIQLCAIARSVRSAMEGAGPAFSYGSWWRAMRTVPEEFTSRGCWIQRHAGCAGQCVRFRASAECGWGRGVGRPDPFSSRRCECAGVAESRMGCVSQPDRTGDCRRASVG